MKNLTFLWKPTLKNGDSICSCCRGFLIPKNSKILLFLLLWLITPPLFAYFATKCMSSSLLDARYMILIFLPYFIMGSLAISILQTKVAKHLFIYLIVIFYAVHTLIPNFLDNAHFSKRILHNWRAALNYVKTNMNSDDSIILRSGFIKENWIPEKTG